MKGVITQPTKETLGLRVAKSGDKMIVIQNFDLEDKYHESVYVDYEEIESLIFVLKEIKRFL
jgi:hypothetical protein